MCTPLTLQIITLIATIVDSILKSGVIQDVIDYLKKPKSVSKKNLT